MKGYTHDVDKSPSPVAPNLKWRWRVYTADGTLNCTGWKGNKADAGAAASAHIRLLLKLSGGHVKVPSTEEVSRKRGAFKGRGLRKKREAASCS